MSTGRVTVVRGMGVVTLKLAQWKYSNDAVLTLAQADELAQLILEAVSQAPPVLPDLL